MLAHLRVNAIPVANADTLGDLETKILAELDPPLNLAKVARTPLRQHSRRYASNTVAHRRESGTTLKSAAVTQSLGELVVGNLGSDDPAKQGALLPVSVERLRHPSTSQKLGIEHRITPPLPAGYADVLRRCSLSREGPTDPPKFFCRLINNS